jgi:hypothetical protein
VNRSKESCVSGSSNRRRCCGYSYVLLPGLIEGKMISESGVSYVFYDCLVALLVADLPSPLRFIRRSSKSFTRTSETGKIKG